MKRFYRFLLPAMLTLSFFNLSAQSRSSYDAAFFKTEEQEAAIEVGKGINITDPFTVTRQCFTSASRDGNLLKKQGTQGATTKVEVFYTKNEYEYNMFKSSNKSGSVSFLNMASLSADEVQRMTSSQNKVSEKLIFIGTVDFGNYFYQDDPVFTSEAQKLLDDGNYDAFKMRYGTHFVSGIGKASTVIVELTMDSDESSNGSSKDFALDAKLKYKADLNFKVSNSSEISNKFRNRGFQVSITVQGPHLETESWEDAILQLRDGEDLIVSVSAYLKNQLKTMQNERDALPVRYFFTDFTMYGCQGIKWNIAKEKKLSSINRNFLECNTIVNMAQENIEKNPIQNPDTYINMAVNLLSQQGSVSYTYDWLVDKAKTLNPQWTSLINSANDLIDKLKKQYDNCSDITCGVNETCCGNIDYTEQVKALFNKYNAIYGKLFNYADEWYAAVEQQEKQRVKKAQFTVVNKSSNPYYIYINGKFDTELAGGYQRTWNANLGTYQIKAVQKSGYLFDATVNLRTVNLTTENENQIVTVGYED